MDMPRPRLLGRLQPPLTVDVSDGMKSFFLLTLLPRFIRVPSRNTVPPKASVARDFSAGPQSIRLECNLTILTTAR